MENKGQWDQPVLFKADVAIGNVFVERTGITYLFVDKEATHELQHGKPLSKVHFHSVKVKLIGSNPNPTVRKEEMTPDYYNFFVGQPGRWASQVRCYNKVVLESIYPGIHMELLTQGDGIKVNFIIDGGNPAQIKMKYCGADKLNLRNDGSLQVQTSLGELVESAPVSFLSNSSTKVPTQFVLKGDTIAFSLNQWQPGTPVTIDPAVVFGTYMGSAADNFGFAASYDDQGNAYGAGTVYAANFPYTAGAYDVTFAGGSSANGEYARDAFLAKFNPGGTSLLFGTFLGGIDNEQPHSVTFKGGEIIVFGTTYSADFPVTNSSYDKIYNGGADLFVLKLSADGAQLLASTFLGGSADDGINGEAHYSFTLQPHQLPYNYADWFRGEVITDLTGNIYITSCTKSTHTQGLPLVNASQSIYGGGMQDGYFAKLNNSLSLVLFSTYVGGSGDDAAYSVCVNNLNEPIIAGGTTSSSLLAGSSSFSYNGGIDGFIAKYSGSGIRQTLIYNGTSTYDQNFFVQTDDLNNIYVMGQTAGNMPKSANTYGQLNAKQYVQKYNASLTSLLLSTTFGKTGGSQPSLSPSAFLVDVCGRIYISGWGGGTNMNYHNGVDNIFGMPTTSDAFQKSTDGADFYLIVLSPDFRSLLYATPYGGSQSQEHVDGGTSHFDKSGVVYQAVCAGCGGLSDFPTTWNAYSRINPGKRAYNTNVGGCNLAVFKFDMRTYILPPVFRDTVLTVYAGKNLTYIFDATDAGGDNLSIFFSGKVLSDTVNPAKITQDLNQPGLIRSTITWNTRCKDFTGDTVVIQVQVLDDACPLPNETKGTIKIVLRSDPLPPPFPDCITITGDQSLELKWINPTPSPDFLNYRILRSLNGETLQVFDSVSLQTQTRYVDNKAPNNLDTNYCYRIYTLNSCSLPGDSSRLICSINRSDTGTGPFFTNLQEELIVLRAYDTLAASYLIKSLDPKDSVFIKASGTLIASGKIKTGMGSMLGQAFLNLQWMPSCADIVPDTQMIVVTVRDNVCPNFRQATKHIRLLVLPPIQATPPNAWCPKKISTDSVLVEWPSLVPMPLTTELVLIRKVNGVRTEIARWNNLGTNKHIDNFTFNLSQQTCYELTTMDFCKYYGDTGLEACIQNNSTPAPNLTIYTATVVNDQAVQLVWQQAQPDSFWRYQLWKRTGRSGNFSMVSEIRNISDTAFQDPEVEVDNHSYCYRLVNMDLCGNLSVGNKEACTILLKGKADPFVNYMDWLPYDYWEMGINRYEVKKTEPGIYTDELFTTTGDKLLMVRDDKLNYDNGWYQYVVEAYESTVGNNQTSRSNTIDLVQKPLLYSPNAITTNGDGLNDKFGSVPVFVRDFRMQIYNRWGERIFETTNKKDRFEPKFREGQIQEDVYFYVITFTGFEGTTETRKGNFTVLR